jgi:hypothetical protein
MVATRISGLQRGDRKPEAIAIYQAILAGTRADLVSPQLASLPAHERKQILYHLNTVREEVASICAGPAAQIELLLQQQGFEA